jgi:calcium binding protein 39
MLYGDAENEPKEAEITRLTEELFASPVLNDLLIHIKLFEFEARKDVASVYNFILRQQKAASIAYIQANESILQILVFGYADAEIALNCGSILREVIRHEELCTMLLHNETLFDSFFEYVQMNTFDVASDAFATFKLMLCKHKALSAKFLEQHFDLFVTKYNVLLQSRNYVTKRQSLKLLGELLLNRANFAIMMKYINSADNLKIMMNLLRGNTKAIQFEAFHVFKIFVANPKKSPAVIDILARNKKKLIEFLSKFQRSGGADGKPQQEDDQFTEEKATLIRTLEQLADPEPTGHEESHATSSSLHDATPQNSNSNFNTASSSSAR